jgi:hypothetical protein
MTNDLRIGPDAAANQALSHVAWAETHGDLTERVEIGRGLHLHADPALRLEGTWRSPRGRIVEIDSRPRGTGHWLGLHLALSAGDLSRMAVLGFACRTVAAEAQVLNPCLRSGTMDGFVDSFFDKNVLSRPVEAAHVDAFSLDLRDDVPTKAPWREIVLFLPVAPISWSLIDMRVFIV